MDTSHLRNAHSIAVAVQRTADLNGLGPAPRLHDVETLYDHVVTDAVLRDTTRSLFTDGYYALAVEEAFKCVNNTVKNRSQHTQDGASMMRSVFSVKNPLLRLNNLRSQSEHDQQQGYMDIFAGCMTGIRNPRAHEHRYLDEPRVALEILSWANQLLRMVDAATRTRKGKKAKTK